MPRKVNEPVAAVKTSAMSKYAKQLKGWRLKRGWTQEELARQLNYSNALVSQVEQLHRPPSADFAARCDEVFDTPETFKDLQELVTREAWPSYFTPLIDAETRAIQIHEWEQRVVPGLLQTEDYARSVIQAGKPRVTQDELDRQVAVRLERQGIFARETDRPLYWVVIHEGVLRHVVGSAEIWQGQLDRLIEAVDSSDIIVQVLPYSANDHPGTDGPILVYDFDGAASSGYTECKGGGMIVEQPDLVAGLMTTMNLIRAAALSPRESREYIVKIRDGIT